jgi:membrane protein
MPRAVAESADRYGLIGVAFAFVSWLVAAGFTLVGSAAAGAVMAERRAG